MAPWLQISTASTGPASASSASMRATAASKTASSTGPAGWQAASRQGTGAHGPVASMARTKAANSGASDGAGARASASSAAPSAQVSRSKSARVAGAAKRLDSRIMPSRATRGAMVRYPCRPGTPGSPRSHQRPAIMPSPSRRIGFSACSSGACCEQPA